MRHSLLLLLVLCACSYTWGYRQFPAQVQTVAVPPAIENGVDVDASALLTSSVRRAVMRHPTVDLVSKPKADAHLELTLLDVRSGLAPMSDPSRRAAQYRSYITVRAVLRHKDGRKLWQVGRVIGQADYLSAPDDIEALDGRRRMALQKAAASAAEQLMTSLTYKP